MKPMNSQTFLKMNKKSMVKIKIFLTLLGNSYGSLLMSLHEIILNPAD